MLLRQPEPPARREELHPRSMAPWCPLRRALIPGTPSGGARRCAPAWQVMTGGSRSSRLPSLCAEDLVAGGEADLRERPVEPVFFRVIHPQPGGGLGAPAWGDWDDHGLAGACGWEDTTDAVAALCGAG